MPLQLGFGTQLKALQLSLAFNFNYVKDAGESTVLWFLLGPNNLVIDNWNFKDNKKMATNGAVSSDQTDANGDTISD